MNYNFSFVRYICARAHACFCVHTHDEWWRFNRNFFLFFCVCNLFCLIVGTRTKREKNEENETKLSLNPVGQRKLHKVNSPWDHLTMNYVFAVPLHHCHLVLLWLLALCATCPRRKIRFILFLQSIFGSSMNWFVRFAISWSRAARASVANSHIFYRRELCTLSSGSCNSVLFFFVRLRNTMTMLSMF